MQCTVSHCDFLYLSSKSFFHVAVLLGTIMLHRLLYKQRMVMFVVTQFLLLSKLTCCHRNFFPLSKPVLFVWCFFFYFIFFPFLQNLVQPDNHTSPINIECCDKWCPLIPVTHSAASEGILMLPPLQQPAAVVSPALSSAVPAAAALSVTGSASPQLSASRASFLTSDRHSMVWKRLAWRVSLICSVCISAPLKEETTQEGTTVRWSDFRVLFFHHLKQGSPALKPKWMNEQHFPASTECSAAPVPTTPAEIFLPTRSIYVADLSPAHSTPADSWSKPTPQAAEGKQGPLFCTPQGCSWPQHM